MYMHVFLQVIVISALPERVKVKVKMPVWLVGKGKVRHIEAGSAN